MSPLERFLNARGQRLSGIRSVIEYVFGEAIADGIDELLAASSGQALTASSQARLVRIVRGVLDQLARAAAEIPTVVLDDAASDIAEAHRQLAEDLGHDAPEFDGLSRRARRYADLSLEEQPYDEADARQPLLDASDLVVSLIATFGAMGLTSAVAVALLIQALAVGTNQQLYQLAERSLRSRGRVGATRAALRAAAPSVRREVRKAVGPGRYRIVQTATMDARRRAVHEATQRAHYAQMLAAAENPAIGLVRWTVSARHAMLASSPDVCDVLAELDHGWGPGLFPPQLVPSLPHPFCQCGLVPELRGPGEPMPSAQGLVLPTFADTVRVIRSRSMTKRQARRATPNHLQRQYRSALTQMQISARVYERLRG